MLAAWHLKPVIGIVTLPERDVACGLQDVVWSQARVWRCGRENGRNRAHMSRFAVTIPRNPTGPILHTITKLHCYCKHSVL